jgi:DNA-binding cell septation regulator SpoVG
MSRPGMRLLRWKPLVKNSLRGFADIELPNGLVIHEIPVLTSHGKCWAALPSKPQLADGRHRTGPDGKPAYTPILEWRSRELSDAFSAKLVKLVREQHPDALDAEGAP